MDIIKGIIRFRGQQWKKKKKIIRTQLSITIYKEILYFLSTFYNSNFTLYDIITFKI